MKNKKGFSLAETVIALAVIVMVSISALTIVLSSLKSKASMNTKLEAQNFAYNALECFKASNEYSDFKKLLAKLTEEGFDVAPELNGEGTTQTTEEQTYECSSSRGYVATITVSYDTDNLDTFKITIIQSEKEIIKLEYERYGK